MNVHCSSLLLLDRRLMAHPLCEDSKDAILSHTRTLYHSVVLFPSIKYMTTYEKDDIVAVSCLIVEPNGIHYFSVNPFLLRSHMSGAAFKRISSHWVFGNPQELVFDTFQKRIRNSCSFIVSGQTNNL